MAYKIRRRMALRSKIQILRTLAKSKSVKRSSIIMDAIHYISKLKLQVEAIKRECQYLVNHIQEVKVERLGTGYLKVTLITCKKAAELLGPILEAFEKLDFNLVGARVTDKHFFGMEAIVQDNNIDPTILNEVVRNVIQRQTENCTF